MPNLNKVMLMGNLTRDPEVKYTPKGTAICEIGLATNRQWTNEQGEKKEEVTFVDIEFFGRQAEVVAEYCKKGKPLFVEGRLKLDTWDDKQSGQKRSKMRVVGEKIEFLGSRESGGAGGGGGGGGESSYEEYDQSAPPAAKKAFVKPTPAPKPARDPDLDVAEEDDIPF